MAVISGPLQGSEADMTPAPKVTYWSLPATSLATSLGSRPEGLTTDEARQALAKHGANSIEASAHAGAIRLLLRQFESPLVLILIFAAVVSIAVQEWTEAVIILLIVAGSTALSFGQDTALRWPWPSCESAWG